MRNALRSASAVLFAAALLGGSSATAMASDPTHGIGVYGTYTGQLVGQQLVVEYVCGATAIGAAVSVNITECGIGDNHPLALPGAQGASAGIETVALAPFQLCFSATATFVDGRTRSADGCTPYLGAASNFAGAGAGASL